MVSSSGNDAATAEETLRHFCGDFIHSYPISLLSFIPNLYFHTSSFKHECGQLRLDSYFTRKKKNTFSYGFESNVFVTNFLQPILFLQRSLRDFWPSKSRGSV